MTATPADAAGFFHEGVRLMAEGRDDDALAAFRQSLVLAPDLAEAHGNLGLLLDQQGDRPQAEHHYRRALALQPTQTQTLLNLGALLTAEQRFAEAEASYRRVLELTPDSPAALSNLGVLLASLKREPEAEACYRQALALDPDYRKAAFNLAYLLLRQGRYEEGWHRLEARDWYLPIEQYLRCPRWQGEDLRDKTLLIGLESGHGDMIQFCRYAALLKVRGARRVDVLCHPALQRLLPRMAGVDTAFAVDQPLPNDAWDYWVPPLSLPFHFATRVDTIPARLPYVSAPPDRVAHWSNGPTNGSNGSRLVKQTDDGRRRLRVGLVWQGNPRFENDRARSLSSLALLTPLLQLDGVRFFSLQKGAGEAELRSSPLGASLIDWGSQSTDFADTAAMVMNLDLVISVDTAVAHLTGALGKPCWILLPDYQTDWRWLTEREDSPWYPDVVRLFRQQAGEGWPAVIDRVASALTLLVEQAGIA